MIKTMIVTGLLSIQKGDNTLLVKDKLLAMLPKKQQLAYSEQPAGEGKGEGKGEAKGKPSKKEKA